MRRLHVHVVTSIVVAAASALAVVGACSIQSDPEVRPTTSAMPSSHDVTCGWWNGVRDPRSAMGAGHGATTGWHRAAYEAEYLAEMVAHHQEAVAAAREIARSERAAMRGFGKSMTATQSAQIRQMVHWLRDWYPEQPTATGYRPMMRDLSQLSGDTLDSAFLHDMIGHHMLAVMMSQQLLRHGTEHDQVARLARAIRDDQGAEIVQMRRWIAQWFSAGDRPGARCDS